MQSIIKMLLWLAFYPLLLIGMSLIALCTYIYFVFDSPFAMWKIISGVMNEKVSEE